MPDQQQRLQALLPLASRQGKPGTQDDILRVAKLLLDPHTLGIQSDDCLGAQVRKTRRQLNNGDKWGQTRYRYCGIDIVLKSINRV